MKNYVFSACILAALCLSAKCTETVDSSSTHAVFGDTPAAVDDAAAPQQQSVTFAATEPKRGTASSSGKGATKWNVRKAFSGPSINTNSPYPRNAEDQSIQTPHSATFSHRSTASSVAQAITGPPRHPERFPGQFLQPRFKNGLVRDAVTAVGEFQGTFNFLITAFLGSRLNASDLEIAIGFALGLLGTIFMHSSSQANPSITAMQLILGKLSARQAGFNVAAQVGAAISASGIVKLMTNEVRSSVALAPGLSPARGLLVETVLSTVLFTTVLYASALPTVKQSLAPFMISLIFFGLEVVGISSTGASLNIARFLGPRVIGGGWTENDWIWALGPAVAAPLSVFIFKANQLIQSPDAEHGDIGPSQLASGYKTKDDTNNDLRFFRQRPNRAADEGRFSDV